MICIYCQRDGADVLIAIVHSNSGPGWSQYAHASCARARGTVRVSDRPLGAPASCSADHGAGSAQ